MYITELDYEHLIRTSAPSNFEELAVRAGDVLDVVTRHYFKRYPLDDSFVSQQFKKAVAYQIQYYEDIGITTMEEVNNQPDSVRIGDTTVSYSRMNSTAKTQRKSTISDDALDLLAGTGLLYRGGGRYV